MLLPPSHTVDTVGTRGIETHRDIPFSVAGGLEWEQHSRTGKEHRPGLCNLGFCPRGRQKVVNVIATGIQVCPGPISSCKEVPDNTGNLSNGLFQGYITLTKS